VRSGVVRFLGALFLTTIFAQGLPPTVAQVGDEPAVVVQDLEVPWPIVPGGQSPPVPVHLAVPCQATESAYVARWLFVEPYDIPGGVTASFSPERIRIHHDDAHTCAAEPRDLDVVVHLFIDVDRSHTALEPIVFAYRAWLEKHAHAGPSPTYGPYTANITFVPQYWPAVNVKVMRAIIDAVPGSTAVFPLTVTNLGNGETRVRFEVVANETGVPEDWVIAPAPLVLGQWGSGAPAGPVPTEVVVQVPDGATADLVPREFNLDFRAESTNDNVSVKEADRLPLVVRVVHADGFALSRVAEAPPPALLWILAAVAAGFVAAGRRRGSETGGRRRIASARGVE
jgi:hypothetical protein